MKNATLRLSDSNNSSRYFDLNFKLEQNHFVKKWTACVLEAQQRQYQISEPWAIYNINPTIDNNFIKANLNRLIQLVDKEEKLFGLQITDIDDQDTLNKIHSIFEKHHGKLDEWRNNPLFNGKSDNFRKNLSEINQLVHMCEASNGSPKIRIVWFDLPKINKFDENDYELFTNKRTFGSLYHLYSDVGKNIEALAEDDDDHHHDLVPNIHYSADCVCYFCDDTEQEVNDRIAMQKNYVKTNADYLAEKGYGADDKRLTTGKIEIAKLQTDLTKSQILNTLKQFNHIQSFFLS